MLARPKTCNIHLGTVCVKTALCGSMKLNRSGDSFLQKNLRFIKIYVNITTDTTNIYFHESVEL